jgi:hypothetical protein
MRYTLEGYSTTMSQTGSDIAHPPRPPLKYRVGLTGHLSVQDPNVIQKELGRVLAEIKAWIGGVAAQDGYGGPVELILVSALARGVDCIGSQAALSLGYVLHAVLPFRETEYRKDFTEPADLVLFEQLLALAKGHTLELDGKRNAQDEAYLIAGETVLRFCDLLVGVWDEDRPLKTGGTRDIVARASEMGLAIVWIDATAQHETCWWRGSRAYDLELLQEHITSPLLPPQGSGLRKYYLEKERQWLRGLPFELLVSVLARRLPRPKIRAQSYLTKSLEDWRPLDSRFPDLMAKNIQPYDQWADNLAIYYAARTRGALTSILFFSAAGLSMGLTLHTGSPPALRALGPALALLSVIFFWAARHGEFSRKWIEYRTLSEMLRNSSLMCAIGGSLGFRARIRGTDHFSSRWAEWYTAAVVRSQGVLPAVIDRHYLEGYWRLLRNRVSAQGAYHHNRFTEFKRVNVLLGRLSVLFFLVAITAAVIELSASLGAGLPESLRDTLSYSWTASIVSAALAAFSNFAGFDRLAIVSRAVAQELSNVNSELENLDHLSQGLLLEKARRATEIMMAEHEDWYLYYSLRDIDRPL